ncbi:hypothetical protein AGMMS49983_12990 [Clostridia bacterium]|nr:hypothetical protein AGMMS49983_12990 [Clostridia bacterium]
MRFKKKNIVVKFALIVSVIMIFGFSGCGNGQNTPAEPELMQDGSRTAGWQETNRDSIVIGGVRSKTGANAIFEQTSFGPQYRMWVDELNRAGGIYIPSIGKKLPIELKIYDDKSDVTTMVRLYEQLCVEEKVDILLPPVTTAHLMAAAPIAQKYGYLMLSGEGGASELEKYIAQNSNVFSVQNYSATQVPAFIEMIKEQGITSVYGVYLKDLLGSDYWEAMKALLPEDVEIKGETGIKLTDGIDAESIINDARASGAQVFLSFCHRDQNVTIAQKAIELGYNPDVYLLGLGGSYDFLGNQLFSTVGVDSLSALEGLMSWGAWNEKSGSAAQAYSEHFRSYWTEKGEFWLNADGTPNPEGTVYQDWYGQICYYSTCQIYQQAIENAGEFDEDGHLNNTKLVEYVKTSEFDTILNEHLKFTDNILGADMYLGEIGQWQSGVFEVIDVGDRRTAEPILPKPAWPTE